MTTIDYWVLLSLINIISHESVIRNPLISLKTHKWWRFYSKKVHGARLSQLTFGVSPNECNRFLLNFLSCGMLSAWCAKLVLKTCRLNFHSPNQSILKEVVLMACRNLNGIFQRSKGNRLWQLWCDEGWALQSTRRSKSTSCGKSSSRHQRWWKGVLKGGKAFEPRKWPNIVSFIAISVSPFGVMTEYVKFSFRPFEDDRVVSSLSEFLSHADLQYKFKRNRACCPCNSKRSCSWLEVSTRKWNSTQGLETGEHSFD